DHQGGRIGEARGNVTLIEIGAIQREPVAALDRAQRAGDVDVGAGGEGCLRVKAGRVAALAGPGRQRVDDDARRDDVAGGGIAIDRGDAEEIGNAGADLGPADSDVVDAQV